MEAHPKPARHLGSKNGSQQAFIATAKKFFPNQESKTRVNLSSILHAGMVQQQ
jgi:hypothetical protein